MASARNSVAPSRVSACGGIVRMTAMIVGQAQIEHLHPPGIFRHPAILSGGCRSSVQGRDAPARWRSDGASSSRSVSSSSSSSTGHGRSAGIGGIGIGGGFRVGLGCWRASGPASRPGSCETVGSAFMATLRSRLWGDSSPRALCLTSSDPVHSLRISYFRNFAIFSIICCVDTLSLIDGDKYIDFSLKFMK